MSTTNKPTTNHVNKSHIEENTSCNHKDPGSGHLRYVANGNSNEHPNDSSQSRDQIVECGNVPLHASGQEDSVVPCRGIHGTYLQHIHTEVNLGGYTQSYRDTHNQHSIRDVRMYCTLIGIHNVHC